MNIFRLAGDLSHVLAIIILLLKIWKTRSCAGNFHYTYIIISSPRKTQYFLYTFVSINRSRFRTFPLFLRSL